MEIKAQANYIRIAPRKMRLVADIVRGLDFGAAQKKLAVIDKRASRPILKLLNSALANATHNLELKMDNLFIREILVNEGPTIHRWMPRAHGSASPIRKRSSMISVILAEKVPTDKTAKKKKKGKIETVKLDHKIGKHEVAEALETDAETKGKKAEDDKKSEIHDLRRIGGNRNLREHEHKAMKQKGFFKKMFRRKSGE